MIITCNTDLETNGYMSIVRDKEVADSDGVNTVCNNKKFAAVKTNKMSFWLYEFTTYLISSFCV